MLAFNHTCILIRSMKLNWLKPRSHCMIQPNMMKVCTDFCNLTELTNKMTLFAFHTMYMKSDRWQIIRALLCGQPIVNVIRLSILPSIIDHLSGSYLLSLWPNQAHTSSTDCLWVKGVQWPWTKFQGLRLKSWQIKMWKILVLIIY